MNKPSVQEQVLVAVQAKRPETTRDQLIDATEWLVRHGYLRRVTNIYGQTDYIDTSKPSSEIAHDIEQDPIEL